MWSDKRGCTGDGYTVFCTSRWFLDGVTKVTLGLTAKTVEVTNIIYTLTKI